MNAMNKQQYVERIRSEYAEPGVEKIDELRKIDEKVKRPANILAFVIGIVGALVLGIGMCLAMEIIGVGLSFGFGLGIAIGVIGILMVIANYFIYKIVLKRRKSKYSAEIIALTNELLNK